ncbi:MAG: hypothetical protein IJ584_15290, partial [Bacteroidales bacterium]|nr:hypothetical protein [Bacteroidales bacterium]
IVEYGVCSLDDESSRAQCISYLRETISRYGMSSHIWALYRDTFQIYDEGQGEWNPGILHSIIGD